jgi:putative regulatory protein, FmdB family
LPTYVFRCQSCGEEFDVRVSYSEKSEVVCPQCGSASLKELFGRYRTFTVGSSDGGGASCSTGFG